MVRKTVSFSDHESEIIDAYIENMTGENGVSPTYTSVFHDIIMREIGGGDGDIQPKPQPTVKKQIDILTWNLKELKHKVEIVQDIQETTNKTLNNLHKIIIFAAVFTIGVWGVLMFVAS